MTAMFPGSGVPYTDAKNSLPDPTTVNCDELWYSTSRCQPRFDPAAANAMLAELINLINKGEVTYDCQFLDQVQLAVRYLIQRGLARAVIVTNGGADNYTGLLDPVLTRYNDMLTLSILPLQNNLGPATLGLNGFPQLPVLRNDGQPIQVDDMRAGVPMELIHWHGNWFVVGVVLSQVPELRTGAVAGWVRTDGLDAPTHDGGANTAARAFRTIQYAYETLGARYFPSPKLVLQIMLGIPGMYEGANIGPYGGGVMVYGNPQNPDAYQIGPTPGPVTYACVQADAVTMSLIGVDLVANAASGNWANLRIRFAGVVHVINCNFDISHPGLSNGAFICAEASGSWGANFTLNFRGNGNQINAGILSSNGQFAGSNQPTTMTFTNTRFAGGGVVSSNLGYAQFPSIVLAHAGCVGPQYRVTDNSIIRAAGQSLPGNAPGIASENGLYFP